MINLILQIILIVIQGDTMNIWYIIGFVFAKLTHWKCYVFFHELYYETFHYEWVRDIASSFMQEDFLAMFFLASPFIWIGIMSSIRQNHRY